MNNKEFISELSRKLGYTNKDTSQLVSSVIGVMTQELQDGNNIAIQDLVRLRLRKAGKNFYQPGYSTTYADSPQVSADLQTQCNFKRKV